MKRLYTIIMALATLVVSTNAQSLSVQNIEAQTGEETALVVSLTEGTSMTALQFNLSLPEGVTLTTSGDTYGTTLGTATDGHTLDVETLSNGDLLFILYNTEQKAFKSGELLRIPITVGSTAIEANGKLYTVRTATADAVSHTCTDASFSVKVTEPEPAYKVGDDITSLATADWEGKTDNYGGLENPAVERYTHAAPEDVDDILTQTITGLRNGTYKVQLDVAASFTPDRGFTCPTGDGLSVAFANGTQENLPVVERGWVGEGDQNTVTLTTTVTDGTLKYGIKNLAPSGNWFVARVSSIVYVSESEDEPGPESVTITADSKSMVYGDNVPQLTYKTEGTSLSGTPQLSTTATKTSAVGTYTIKVGKGTVINTSVTYVDGTLTITKAPLNITAKSYTIKQGEALPAFAATYSGFKNSETESVLTKKPTFSCSATSASAPGTYDIVVSGAEAGNYDISYVKGTLTIEKKEEPEPITRSPFKGEISLPGTLEAENFDKGGEGIAYHDSDAEDHGGTNYRSGADAGVDIVTGNGGYALGWTNGGEWAEYTVNVIEAGKYTLEAIVSNGTGDTGGFSISLVGDGGSLTKLADVNVPSTAGNWENYQPVEGELLQNLEVGSQIFRITITAGNCNIDKIKFELKKDEPEPEPEPAYKVGDDITSLATTEWEGKTGDYGGLANASVERYTHGAPADVDDILTQTVTGLRNGTYKVQLDVAASFTSDRGFTCPTGNGLSVAFANGTQRNLAVVERGWVDEGAQKIVTLTATVTDGTLKYGIKNLAPSGNWFIARLRSIVYVSESNQTPKTYAISIASEKNGTTVTDVEAEEEGSRVFITATPDEDCTLESIKVTTTGGKEVEVTNNSFIMPASAVKVSATYKEPVVDAIEDVVAEDGTYEIYTIDGKPIETLQKGVNIIRFSNGTTKSVYVK
ncbi:MAG: carbohydrate-binding protein [Bacteroidaceae bacterium]|nr:carbohydrate-binding protein [Bacteroidaceae bacterium]